MLLSCALCCAPSCRDALDAALATRRPDVVHAMLDELSARGGLHTALAGRDAAGLLPLLRHLAKYIADPRHSAALAGVAGQLLDIYAPVVHTHAQVRLPSGGGSGLLRACLHAGLGVFVQHEESVRHCAECSTAGGILACSDVCCRMRAVRCRSTGCCSAYVMCCWRRCGCRRR